MSIRSQTGWPAFGGEPADMIEIDQLISAYAHTVDANRYEDNARLFTDDGVMELLFEINQTQQLAFLLVTHNEEIAARCHRMIRLKDGLVVG